MRTTEVFVPAVITRVETIDPGEIRLIALTLRDEYEVGGRRYRVRDAMRPGNAFLARPWGARSGKVRRRMYTRSNCAATAPLVLETIINHTHEERADTSIWWQTDQIDALHRGGGSVDVRVDLDQKADELVVFENSSACDSRNLRLEPDGEWPSMRMVAIALSTGITPFLAYLDYMRAAHFGRSLARRGAHVTLIASVRHPRQLMKHEELLDLERRFPDHFRYYPVLTREWPDDWPYGKGRIICADDTCEGEPQVDLTPLLKLVPDLSACHLRMCGNLMCRRQIELGLRQQEMHVQSFRAEVW